MMVVAVVVVVVVVVVMMTTTTTSIMEEIDEHVDSCKNKLTKMKEYKRRRKNFPQQKSGKYKPRHGRR
jgi:hypothetical protein